MQTRTSTVIEVVGEQNAQQSAPDGIIHGNSQTGTDFPIHVLTLPGAGANQYHNYGCISDVTIP